MAEAVRRQSDSRLLVYVYVFVTIVDVMKEQQYYDVDQMKHNDERKVDERLFANDRLESLSLAGTCCC